MPPRPTTSSLAPTSASFDAAPGFSAGSDDQDERQIFASPMADVDPADLAALQGAVPVLDGSADATPFAAAALRARAKPRAKRTNSGLTWAIFGIVLAASLGLAAVFRAQVVRVWPQSASAYVLVGLAVNPTGLVFEKIKAVQVMQDGHAALRISGAIRNIEDRPRDLPPVRIALLDPQGKTVMVQIGRMDGVRIPARQSRYFSTVLVDPPARARDMNVTFDVEKPKVGVRAH